MTDVSRGARRRRGDRGSGWFLLTSLLVLAILASSTLVFTNRVELLRLAVILALWAAVVAAFVTVIYRRQSELDQARARDMKFVYDLQLDREISARREYELSVESHLRRSLSREIRAEAADELAGLRAELAALRAQLEVMLGTDLAPRPALESDRVVIPMPAAPGRVESRRVLISEDVRFRQETVTEVENRIIDVPEAPLVDSDAVPSAPPPVEQFYYPQDYRGSHRRPMVDAVYSPPQAAESVVVAGPEPEPEPVAEPEPEPEPGAESVAPEPAPETVAEPVAPAPVVESAPAYVAAPPTYVAAPPPTYVSAPPPASQAPWRPPEVRPGRHSSDGALVQQDPYFPAEPAPESARGRHWVPADDAPETPGRHRPPGESQDEPAEDEQQGQHAGGQSFADLMARFQVNPPSAGGGRRRRED
jgi:hypothetical protein